jgi:cytochrome c5
VNLIRTKRVVLWVIAATAALLTQSAVRSQSQTAGPPPPRQTTAQSSASSSAGASAAAEGAVIKQYCVTCHNDKLKTDGLSLENADLSHIGDKPQVWEKVVRKLLAGLMPPPGVRRPDLQSYEGLTTWLENALDRSAAGKINPGTMGGTHRLNRIEYARAVKDLLDVEVNAADLLPVDDSSDGFDNQADTLTTSSTLLEAYVKAASQISKIAVGRWTSPTESTYIPPDDTSQEQYIEGLPFGTRGGMLVRHTFPSDGDYRFYIQSLNNGTVIPGEQLIVTIDGVTAKSYDWDSLGAPNPLTNNRVEMHVDFKMPVKAGAHDIGVTFLQTNNRPSLDIYHHFSRSTLDNYTVRGYTFYPAVGYLKIAGPFDATVAADTPSRRKIFVCRPANAAEERPCAERIVSTLARHAFRRPVTARDTESLMNLYETAGKSGDFEARVEMAIRGILADPEFLFRTEAEPANLAVGSSYRISDLELASRLSFFLWSSIPDDQLIDLASRGKLHDSAVLEQQVRRMLNDDRSRALVESFATQWLSLRNLNDFEPNALLFPDWEDNLRQAFRRETEMFFESIVREDRNVTDLLTADYTFVNERLARHYGIPNIYGARFRRVTLGPEFDVRRGLLGKGSFLAVSSLPERISFVKRGVWVLETILGTHPPDPPPVVPALEDTPGAQAGRVLSLRERMEMHRKNQPCAGCHRLMDPIGLSLQNFDVDGIWRTKDGGDGGLPIDASSELFDGQKITGVVELRNALLRYSPQFRRNITEKLMTYAVGRRVEYYDMPVVRAIVRDAGKQNYRFSSIIAGIVKSPEFQMRMKTADSASKE